MGSKRIAGIILLVAGVIVVILSLAADTIGIGGMPSFGPYQIAGTVAGVVAVVLGAILTRSR